MSGNQAGTVSVLVTAVESFGTNQTLVILVKVGALIVTTFTKCLVYSKIVCQYDK